MIYFASPEGFPAGFAAPGGGAPGSDEGVGQQLPFATKLHSVAFPSRRVMFI